MVSRPYCLCAILRVKLTIRDKDHKPTRLKEIQKADKQNCKRKSTSSKLKMLKRRKSKNKKLKKMKWKSNNWKIKK